MSPTSWLSRLRTVSFMARPPRGRFGAASASRSASAAAVAAQRRRVRQPVGRLALDGVLDQDPALLAARHRALDQEEAALGVGDDDLEALRGHPRVAHVAGHLLVLEGLAGICRCPVEPRLRCDTETPWVARKPPKLCRFMPPAKPLPMLVPVTSTYWPGEEVRGGDLGPDRRPARLRRPGTRRACAFGSTLALAKWPRCGLVTFLTLAAPTPSCSAV